MADFLPDATNFDDLPLMADPGLKYEDKKNHKICPKCKGHGKWNLLVNRYPIDGDRPKHHAHFQGACGACWGWGWIPETQTCVHEWTAGKNVGRCLNEWECKHCPETRVVDSSD